MAVDLVWTATNGSGTTGESMIAAEPGDVITLEVQITADAAGVCCAALSLRFDDDLQDELDLVNATETQLVLPGPFSPLNSGVQDTRESDANQSGLVLTFEGMSPTSDGPASSTFTLGQVDFLVTSHVGGDAADVDVEVGFFNPGVDAIGDNASQLVPSGEITFGTASVEPATAPVPLLGRWGVVALVLALASLGTIMVSRRFRRPVTTRA